jgi:hypothetical protein
MNARHDEMKARHAKMNTCPKGKDARHAGMKGCRAGMEACHAETNTRHAGMSHGWTRMHTDAGEMLKAEKEF